MAIIETTGTLIRQYNAFTGLSALERSQSGIARAEIVYYNVNDDWPAPGAGNNRSYTTGEIDLPKDFGYVLTDAYCRIDDNALIQCSATSLLRILPGGVLGPQINVQLESTPDRQTGAGNTPVGDIPANEFNSMYVPTGGEQYAVLHQLASRPTSIIYPFASQTYTTTLNPASQWRWTIGEQAVNGNAYDVSVYFRFLQYDIDQSYNYVIQSPQLTR